MVARCSDLALQASSKVRKRFYVVRDHLGSTLALTDSSGSVVQSYSYDAFGSAYVKMGGGSSGGFVALKDFTGNLHGNTRFFTGREYDGETGMYYMRARYYDSGLGRFLSRDPIGTVDDVNMYSYVGNRVVGFVDRRGREKRVIATITIYSTKA